MLGSIAMVYIPVNNKNSQGIVGNALGIAGSQGSSIKEAETTCYISLGMVSRGTNNSHTIPHLPRKKQRKQS